MSDLSNPLQVLIIEDNSDDCELILLQLEREYNPVIFQQVDSALSLNQALDKQNWDVILADYSLPQFGALEALALLQNRQLDIPFIIVSGTIGEETAVLAMKAGAHDYLLKGNLTRLVPAIEREIREAKVRKEHQQTLNFIQYLAFYDELTGLGNQTKFLNDLRQRLEKPRRDSNLFAVILINIERYYRIKYGLGHDKGLELLKQVADRLQGWMTLPNKIARIEENQLAILLESVENQQEIEQKIYQLHQILSQPFALDPFLVYSSISIGVVDSRIEFTKAEDFFRAADIANYYAHQKGINQTVFFSSCMQTKELERLHLETELKQAIQQQQLQLHYQPIVALQTGKVIGFEALVRWFHPQRGWISPAQFIPLAEQSGLIIPVGEWVLEEALRQMQIWQSELAQFLPLSVAVNLSGMQLAHPQLVEKITTLYCHIRVPNFSLKLEVTETVLMENTELAIRLLNQLQEHQFQICLDDFGTGYSSLSYLRNFPIDVLKVDRSFIQQMQEDHKNYDIIKAIIALGKTLGLEVIAEGIETVEQLQLLRSLSCPSGQGYLFSKPLPANQILPWIQAHHLNQELFLAPHQAMICG